MCAPKGVITKAMEAKQDWSADDWEMCVYGPLLGPQELKERRALVVAVSMFWRTLRDREQNIDGAGLNLMANRVGAFLCNTVAELLQIDADSARVFVMEAVSGAPPDFTALDQELASLQRAAAVAEG